jgi:hypothetical protein
MLFSSFSMVPSENWAYIAKGVKSLLFYIICF